MAYTDPAKDVDVSAQMEYGGVVEIGLTQMWYLALRDKCVQPGAKRALVLDVGANFGWYSIYAAMLGCRYALHAITDTQDIVLYHLDTAPWRLCFTARY